jgi:hypothetical protein
LEDNIMAKISNGVEYERVTSRYPPIHYDDLNAERWQLDLLKLNHGGCYQWQPGNDLMGRIDEGDWDSSLFFENWAAFTQREVSQFNLVADYYFYLCRENEDCKACDGSGLSPRAKNLSKELHELALIKGEVTYFLQEENIESLMASKAIPDIFGEVSSETQMVEMIKDGTISSIGFFSHKACLEGKARSLGFERDCHECNGKGFNFSQDKAHASLVVWMLHPRFGASRGIEIKEIQEGEIPEIQSFLQDAATLNQQRFKSFL